MPGSVFNRRVDAPVHFQDKAGGFVLDGKLESVRLFVPDAGERELVLVVWFDYWMFRRIDRAHLFGYTFESIEREGLTQWELTSALPVQLELRAEGAARDALAGLAGDALLEQAAAALTGADTTSPLVDAANYRYLAVYQEKRSGDATYLAGFTSVYRKQG
ncbi:MAG TPA: hypothetical protein VHE35_32650 [Kofleriaceae bacterium]|nr:hypothetical protein [Kofleriaceae bacterium]